MKKEGRKMTWAIGLIAGLGVLSIAYAALSSTLQINGDTTKVNVHGVEFLDTSKGYAIGDDTTDKQKSYTDKFDEAPANALGKLGTCTLGTLAEGELQGTSGVNRVRQNDKITISGTELYEWGAYVVYKLDLQNFASNDMKLTTLPEITIDADSDIEDRIEVKFYSDADCKNLLSTWSNETDSTNANWLKKATTGESGGGQTDGGTTSWYAKVYNKQYSKNSNWELKDGKFTFTVTPVWEAA